MTQPGPRPPRQPLIRQNPGRRPANPSGQHCALHGHYTPPQRAEDLRYEAQNGELSNQARRDLLDAAAKLIRHCPTCDGPAPRTITETLKTPPTPSPTPPLPVPVDDDWPPVARPGTATPEQIIALRDQPQPNDSGGP